MARTEGEWLLQVRKLCVSTALPLQDAEDCVAETLIRYCRWRGAYPWEEAVPDEPLLRLLAHNVAREYQRTAARRQRLERVYCAVQQALIATAPDLEQQAVSNAHATQFRAELPRYLKRTLTLLEAGYTPAEIASVLGVCESTVRAYRRALRARFVRFFGYDPTNRGSCVVNCSGSASTGFPICSKEVYDETASENAEYHSVVVGSYEPRSNAAHPCRAERVQRGGQRTP